MKLFNLTLTSLEIMKEKITQNSAKKEVDFTNDKSKKYKAVYEELKNEGVAIIQNFLNDEEITKIKNEIDAIFKKYDEKLWKDDLGADLRAFGINRVSKLIDRLFYKNELIQQVSLAYYNCKSEDLNGYTMANVISALQDNLGSGGGWHRDTVNKRQFKSILYLSDVSDQNGPFQYIPRTHYKKNVLGGIINYNFKHNHNRFTEPQITQLLSKEDKKLQTLTGQAGTLILADTSGIHRGAPIKEGKRYALTNYYWNPHKIHIHEKFENLSIE